MKFSVHIRVEEFLDSPLSASCMVSSQRMLQVVGLDAAKCEHE